MSEALNINLPKNRSMKNLKHSYLFEYDNIFFSRLVGSKFFSCLQKDKKKKLFFVIRNFPFLFSSRQNYFYFFSHHQTLFVFETKCLCLEETEAEMDYTRPIQTTLTAEMIANELKGKPKMTTINLGGVSLKDDGMVLISQAMIDNHELETINLSATDIGAHQNGIDALCDLLRHCPKLKSLNIMFNLFEHEGLIAIREALDNCMMLENLYVSHPVGEIVFRK